MTLSLFKWLSLTLLVVALPLGGTAWAIDSLSLSLENLVGRDIQAKSASIDFEWTGIERAKLELRINGPDLSAIQGLPEALKHLKKIHFRCDDAQVSLWRLSCEKGVLVLPYKWLDRSNIALSVDYDLRKRILHLSIPKLALAGGRHRLKLMLSLASTVPKWTVDLRLGKTPLRKLLPLLTAFDAAPLPVEVEAGSIVGSLNIRASKGVLEHLNWQMDLSGLTASNAEGTVALEDARVAFKGQAKYLRSRDYWSRAYWSGQASVVVDAGQYYVDPLFVEVTDAPIRLALKGSQNAKGIRVEHFELAQRGVAKISGKGELAKDGMLKQANIEVVNGNVALLYQRYIQAFVADTALAELEGEGRFSGGISIRDGGLSAFKVSLKGVSIDDQMNRFGLYDVNANLEWDKHQTKQSSLTWDSGHLFNLDLGAVDWIVESRDSVLTWQVPTSLPIMDGELIIDELVVGNKDESSAVFKGVLTPLSLRKLSHAFGWPTMEGKLSGVIPKVSLRDSRFAVDGVLLVRAFDGQLTIRDLTIAQPMGVAPELTADVQLDNLDLEALTNTFAFGKIQGRLEGWVRDLRMVAWQPVSFDAGLQTPKDDDSRHRISQRAVDNLTSLGGGVGGALSKTFLRFFEEFSYDRLGLTCKLQGSVCQMGGVGDAKRGYYIVKGGGLPRIDVIGYSHEVDWPTMLERLQRITAESGPVIE